MKKFLCILLAALFVLSLTGCGMKRSEFGGKPVSLMPKYVGEGVDDPFYQFTEEDLVVRIVYDDGQIADMEDGFKVTTETDSGFFDILVSWNAVQVFGRTETVHGGVTQDLFASGAEGSIGVEQQVPVLFGQEEAGSDGVYTDANGGKVYGQPLGKVGNGSLGTAVGGNSGQRTEAVHMLMADRKVRNPANWFPQVTSNCYSGRKKVRICRSRRRRS